MFCGFLKRMWFLLLLGEIVLQMLIRFSWLLLSLNYIYLLFSYLAALLMEGILKSTIKLDLSTSAFSSLSFYMTYFAELYLVCLFGTDISSWLTDSFVFM